MQPKRGLEDQPGVQKSYTQGVPSLVLWKYLLEAMMNWLSRQVRTVRDAVSVLVFEIIGRLFPDNDPE